MNTETDPKWKLTPKGFLAVETGMFGRFDPVWDALIEFVSKQAKINGMEGVPCLVLVDGGHCITAEKRAKKEEAAKMPDAASLTPEQVLREIAALKI